MITALGGVVAIAVHGARARGGWTAKAIAEFSHERLLAPIRDGDGWRLELEDGRVCYRFRAERLALEHWLIDEPSLERMIDGVPTPLDAQQLVLELRPGAGGGPVLARG